jgi:Ca-activated chloride channel family protein
VQSLVLSAQRDSALLAPGSDLGAAVRAAARALEGTDTGARAIVLVTDGEDHEGDALAAAQDAAADGVHLFVVGVGTAAGAAVPAFDAATGTVAPPSEDAPVSRLGEALLRRVAATSADGVYTSAAEMTALADEIDALDGTTFDVRRERLPIERFQWVALAAIALLVAEALLPERRMALRWPLRRQAIAHGARALPRGSRVAVIALALVGLTAVACGSSAGGLIADGNRAYERGDYEEALELYRRAAADEPELPEAHLNAGLALHRLGRYAEAADETARALPAEEPSLAARVHYAVGNHYFALGRLPEALDAYREALLLEPGNRDAKHNFELALRRLQEGSAAGPGQPRDADGAAPGGAGDGGSTGPASGEAAATSRALAAALAGAGDDLSVQDALTALDLVRELQRQSPTLRPNIAAGDPVHPDY